jgi:hypothetical protein
MNKYHEFKNGFTLTDICAPRLRGWAVEVDNQGHSELVEAKLAAHGSREVDNPFEFCQSERFDLSQSQNTAATPASHILHELSEGDSSAE